MPVAFGDVLQYAQRLLRYFKTARRLRRLAQVGSECGHCRHRRQCPHSLPTPCELPKAVRSLEESRAVLAKYAALERVYHLMSCRTRLVGCQVGASQSSPESSARTNDHSSHIR